MINKFNIAYLVAAWATLLGFGQVTSGQDDPVFISGINPRLAHTNLEKEVGIGAVVPWAGSLWTNTYGPHLPHGSSDKLRQINKDWIVVERPESVGGTPANRMIHRETRQLLIGHHLIDNRGNIRTIDPKTTMPGRITANARHLTSPESKVYYLTMENGVYEVDVNSLEVKTIIADPINISQTFLPGYHGKGAYTGSGQVVVSNNGEPDSTYPSGCLAAWDGNTWRIIARNQFTEVTGPGGLEGNNSSEDRVWAVGWDTKSVRLFLLQEGRWSKFRLPKGSYTHDSNHGWNTEWPRIRQVKSDLTLMHMHGLFFKFPKAFCESNTANVTPLCTYVKMPVDYAWFNNKLVIGKDDASMFDNKFVKQAQSNLWVGDPDDLKNWGPKNGFGGVWLHDSFDAGQVSEPFLVNGFKHIHIHLHHAGGFEFPVEIQIDRRGTGDWTTLGELTADKVTGYANHVFSDLEAQWLRLVAKGAAAQATAYFQMSSPYLRRPSTPQFEGLEDIANRKPPTSTLQLANGKGMRLNVFAKSNTFVVSEALEIARSTLDRKMQVARQEVAIEREHRVGVDQRSAFVVHTDSSGNLTTLRLPKGNSAFDKSVGNIRHIREIVTERSTLNLHGTFYELPRPVPGNYLNFWQMKPISSHSKHIHDFCSWRGMLVFSGAKPTFEAANHVGNDEVGIWLGEVDDLWKLGKPIGEGSVWSKTRVELGDCSDPYLILGYDKKSLLLRHEENSSADFALEVDFLGRGKFVRFAEFTVEPFKDFRYQFPEGFAAHWVRVVAKSKMTASATFIYE